MRTLRQTCATTILTLALAVSILAGEVDCPAVVDQPKPPTTTTSITTTVILAIVGLIK